VLAVRTQDQHIRLQTSAPLVEEATENAAVVQALIDNSIGRGLKRIFASASSTLKPASSESAPGRDGGAFGTLFGVVSVQPC
jgi:hypothetical protein